jgi:hypothetical protein
VLELIQQGLHRGDACDFLTRILNRPPRLRASAVNINLLPLSEREIDQPLANQAVRVISVTDRACGGIYTDLSQS